MARQDYVLDGSRQFVFPFAVQDASDLRLQLFPGTAVPQEDYTVTGAGPASQGVTVTWPDAPTEPEVTLAIIRETPPVRVTDFPNNQAVSARALNAEFDNVYQVIVDFIESTEERVDTITNELVPASVDAYLDEELPGLVEALAQPFVTQAEAAADNAALSESNAAASATAASDSATAASDSATAASDSATAASDSATAAGVSASAAAGSRDTALGAAAESEDLVTQATSGFVGFQDGIGYDFGIITSPMTYFDRDWGLITDTVD